MRKWCCQQFQRWVSYQTSLTGNGALHIRRTLVDYSWCTEPYRGWNELEQGQFTNMYILYCSENFGNLFIFEFAGKGFFVHGLVPKISFWISSQKSFFLISEENIPEKIFRMEFISWRRSWKAVGINLLIYVCKMICFRWGQRFVKIDKYVFKIMLYYDLFFSKVSIKSLDNTYNDFLIILSISVFQIIWLMNAETFICSYH